MASIRIRQLQGPELRFATGFDGIDTLVDIDNLWDFFDGMEGFLEVPDASIDLRFSNASVVTCSPFVRFLFSVVLRSADNNILCALSVMAPHEVELTDLHRVAIKEIAGIAIAALRSHDIPVLGLEDTPLKTELATNNLLEMAIQDNDIGTWELDLASGELQWNDVMFELFGGTRGTFGGLEEDWLKFVHPEDVSRVKQELLCALENSATFSSEYRIRNIEGVVKYINAHGTVIRNSIGQPTRLVGSNRDVSDRVLAQVQLQKSERRLRMITDKLPVLIASVDKEYRYTFANNNFDIWYALGGLNIPGHQVPGVIGKTVGEVFETASFNAIKPYIDQAMNGNEVSVELDMPPSNAPPHIFLYCAPELDDRGQIIGVLGLVIDRTAEVQARKKIAESENQLRAITDNLPALIAYVDAEERVRFINRTYCERLKITKEYAIGKTMLEVEGPELHAKRRDFFLRALLGEHVEFEAQYGESSAPVYMQTKLVSDVDPDGQVKGVFKLCTDVSDLKRVEAELRKSARIDSLTGLPNRVQFNESLKLAHDRNIRSGAITALLYLDIDYFKQINDSLGHGAGDSVLSEFANRIKSVIRSTDTAARLAGDEFVVILEDLTCAQQAKTIASKINKIMRAPIWINHDEINITTSIGIAFHRGPATDLNDWISRADRALYRAKAVGRDTFVVESAGF
ncbi:sensor domain-containing protein [Rheinheimera texasensis]|uniref:sensor domain-containing protein n=1 Tax=Rheinheimera texasensis TaxID=306205 RepID=UPI00146FA2F9|nr:diguanylate cyclase [Rheinheimera texasensis]